MPLYAEAHYNLGTALHWQDNFQGAVASLREAVRLKPDFHPARVNLGRALLGTGEYLEARRELEQLLVQLPSHADALLFCAIACQELGDFAKAIDYYERVLALKPDSVDTLGNLANSCRDAGDFPRAAEIYERILAMAPGNANARNDYSHALRAEPCDYQIPIGSLAQHFRRSPGDFPRHSGYLRADPGRTRAWSERLAALGGGRKIGISWRGGFVRTRRHLRSIGLESWLPILRVPGATFVSLQYTDCAAELEALRERHGVTLHHWQEAIDDYDETAALVSALDLVVSVCTAAVHLTGSLAKPAWVLVPGIPEWRYQQSGDRMPWYPSIELLRQERAGEWGAVIGRVAGQLRDFTA